MNDGGSDLRDTSGDSTSGVIAYPSAETSPSSQNEPSTPLSTDSKGSASRPWKSRVKSALGSLRKNRRASREKANSPMAAQSCSDDSDAIDTESGNDIITSKDEDFVKSLDFKLPSRSESSELNEMPSASAGAFPSKSNFSGERGGDATDPDLLAILREVSLKSSGAGRFDDGENPGNSRDDPDNLNGSADVEHLAMRAIIAADIDDIDEEKQKSPKRGKNLENNPAVIPPESSGYGIKSEVQSTFQGERGGSAEDAELLALLRGVSAKSSGADRFADTNEDVASAEEFRAETIPAPVSPNKEPTEKKAERLPPWKRKGPQKTATEDVEVVAAPKAKGPVQVEDDKTDGASLPPESSGYGIKSEVQSTFQGERGGSAEDAELLALLRGVSAKSSGADRFADTNEDVASAEEFRAETIPAPVSPNKEPTEKKAERLPPWKRKGPQKTATEDVEVVAAPKAKGPVQVEDDKTDGASLPPESSGYGIKSEVQSTFQGERGGSAEDAELLALLRGVSAKSSGADRFADTNEDVATAEDIREQSPLKQEVASRHSDSKVAQNGLGQNPRPHVINSSSARETEHSHDENDLDRANVNEALDSKDWKTRVKAFDFLISSLKNLSGSGSRGDIESDLVLEGLDSIVPRFYEETQIAALDKALEFGILYADHCKGATNAGQARSIALSMIRKNAFSSRPSTSALAHSLIMKLIEVGESGTPSLFAVVEVLLEEGMASKKPKIVQAVASVLHEITLHFGFSNLPLASLVENLPKLLSHTNATVRESGLKITAEICRGLGSKAAIQNVIETMKSAQVSQLDKFLAEQPGPSPVLTGLRALGENSKIEASPNEAAASLAARAEELEAERFAARPAVDLVSALSKTEYSVRLQHPKWSEKVAALQMVLECGGETPYKLAPPSSAVNYAPLIADMKSLLAHTHFAVCNNAMQVLSMLAEGVGEKLFPYLRPLLVILFRLSKDKKLTKGVANCLDSFFGNIVGFTHLLEEDVLPASVDEKTEKNALARAASMEFLGRCLKRSSKAGSRGILDGDHAKRIASLCIEKLEDSDASVRKASIQVLQSLKDSSNPEIRNVFNSCIESLRLSNPRVHKTLAKVSESVTSTKVSPTEISHRTNKEEVPVTVKQNKVPSGKAPKPSLSIAGTQASSVQTDGVTQKEGYKSGAVASTNSLPTEIDDALEIVTSMKIPLWDEVDEGVGIYAGLKSSKWLHRQDSVKSITNFVESGSIDTSPLDVGTKSASLMLLVKEHTRGFKDTNVNILKAIMEFFIAVCEYHESKEIILEKWIVRDGVELAIHKISDKKLIGSSKEVLTHLCLVASPGSVIGEVVSTVKGIKAPVVHEESLRWVDSFCSNFGAPSLGSEVSILVSWVVEELKASNPRIKREAHGVLAVLFRQLGPNLKVLSMSLTKSPEIKSDMDLCFSKVDYDPLSLPASWPKQSLTARSSVAAGSDNQVNMKMDLLKTDLFSLLPPDIISKMGTKNGKAAWKQRKEALDEVERALSDSGGLVDTSPSQRKKLADLSRALRERLSDTQINLKPVAAKAIGRLLSAVDSATQAKLGKIVYSPLLNAAMSDIKKPMRDACLAALRAGTALHPIEGGGLSIETVEPLVSSLIGEITESTIRAPGLAEVLGFMVELSCTLPNLDEMSSSMGQQLGAPFAQVIVECLTSSKTETRSAATDLLDSVLSNKVVGVESFRKAVGKLVPAKQRTVGPLIAKYTKTEDPTSQSNTSSVETSKSRSNAGRSTARIPAAVPIQNESSSRKPQNASTEKNEEPSHSIRHPLEPRTSSISRPSSKSIIWPDYPDEPQGTSIFLNLKKSWCHLLSGKSSAALFPNAGIRKQDEAKGGCDVLLRALKLDREGGHTYILDQLDYVLKWTAFALCSRETTTGLQTLLMFVKELLSYLIDRRHELSDSEALDFVPYIVDRASNAKGRFGEVLHSIVDILKTKELLPPKRLGSVICVTIIERSPHAKARGLACQICHECILLVGLNGCGKRGVIAAAKALSEEKVAETRLAALNLLEVILSKMNGDIQRLSRICGPSLSDKAASDIEEKWNKRNQLEAVSSPVPNTHRFMASANYNQNGLSGNDFKADSEDRQSIRDELPAFRLDSDPLNPTDKEKEDIILTKDVGTPGHFTLSCLRSENITDNNEEVDVPGGTEYHVARDLDEAPGKTDGTAASLRMRLLEIKEKSKTSDESVPVEVLRRPLPNSDMEFTSLRSLLKKKGPLPEHDDELLASIEALKKIHAALSKQGNSTLGLSVDEILHFRDSLTHQIDALVDLLTRLIEFSFDCGIETVNEKMSIPLLSVCLATLMALFRDNELSHKVSQDNLTLLIRQTGTALLDNRLGTSSVLDEATASQMVRALNKLAVQAATGAVRHYSFMALLALQQQLACEDDSPFNNRLSRVIVKLFVRVVKAEEGSDAPYSPSRVDMEALVCAMEDALERSSEFGKDSADSEIGGAYSDMVHSLVQSIINAHQGSASLLHYLEVLEIDPKSSALGRSIQLVESQSLPVSVESRQPQQASRDVASLVSALGNAPEGPQREAALNALLSFKDKYGDEELNAHLNQVSFAFRSFIEDQIRERNSLSKHQDHDSNNVNMSDRLRSLRSRLQATELALQTTVDDSQFSPERHTTQDVSEERAAESPLAIPTHMQRSSKLLQPSPSRVAFAANTTSSQSLQERLAMAQENRKGTSLSGSLPSSSDVGTSMGRAAALRARLEAVKNKGKTIY